MMDLLSTLSSGVLGAEVIGLFAKKKIISVVLFLTSTSPAKSASLNLVNNA
jgi:hypothetical protein